MATTIATTTMTTIISNRTLRRGEMSCQMDGSIINVFYSALMVMVLVTGAIGNCLVITAVTKSPRLKRWVTAKYLVSLAISDLMLASTQIPFKISSKLHGRFCQSLPACYFLLMTDAFGNIASIFNLLLIAMDRFLAVALPYRYPQLMNTLRAKVIITCTWFVAVCWSSIGIIRWNTPSRGVTVGRNACVNDNYLYYALSYFGVYLPSLVIITCAYLKILYIAIHHIRAIKSTTPNKNYLVVDDKAKRKNKFNVELRATKSIGFVYLAFLICWFPSCIINGIILIDHKYFPRLKKTNQLFFSILYYLFVDILPMVNTMVNPFIYSFSNRMFRKAFKRIINKLTLKKITFLEERQQTKSRSKRASNTSHV